MRPGPPVQPSRRRPPRRQEPHQERNRRHRQDHHQPHPPHPRPNGSSSRALLVLLLLASSPLVLGLAEPPGLSGAEWQQALSRQTYPKSSFGRAIQPRKQQNLTIGYLTAIKGGLKDRQGLAISGAFSMALDEVSFLPGCPTLSPAPSASFQTTQLTRLAEEKRKQKKKLACLSLRPIRPPDHNNPLYFI